MFRLRRTFSLLALAAVAAPISGCRTMYRDVYSPQRNYFVPLEDKAATAPLPEEKEKPKTSTVIPNVPSAPSAPAAPPSAPAIPGLDALPGAAPAPEPMAPPPQ